MTLVALTLQLEIAEEQTLQQLVDRRHSAISSFCRSSAALSSRKCSHTENSLLMEIVKDS